MIEETQPGLQQAQIINVDNQTSRPIKNLILALTALVFFRLLGFIVAFGERSLQMDFSAFYTAGEAVNAGLSPYINHYTMSPPIWDGVNIYTHSRFLYPPLAANLFQPVAVLPYHTAKYLWMVIILLAIYASLSLSTRVVAADLANRYAMLPVLFLLLFHPLLTLLERGQIDGISLLLLTTGFFLIATHKRQGIAGVLLAAATLLKLHTILILPFLVLRRRWQVLAGYAVGATFMLVITFILWEPSALVQYAAVELPRISTYGEGGTETMLADRSVISSLQSAPGLTVKDGRVYSPERFLFITNASLVWTPVGRLAQRFLSVFNLPNSISAVSLLIFSSFFAIFVVAQWMGYLKKSLQPPQEFLYWQLILVVILLSAPLTWVMNTIWLLPLFPFVVASLTTPQPSHRQFSLIIITLGLVVIALPDHFSYRLLLPFEFLNRVAAHKYVFGELIIFAGLFLYLVLAQRQTPTTSA